MVALSLTATPQSQSIVCNVNYSGSASEFIIFYFAQGSTVIYSESSPSPNNIIISNLTNGVTYNLYASVFLSSYTSGTNISESALIQCMPSELPSQVNLSATVSTSGNDLKNTVVLNYTQSSCSYPILHYNIFQDNNLIAQPTELTYSVQNLTYGQSYTFAVSAVAIVGQGSQATVTVTPVSVPNIPSGLLVNYDPTIPNEVDVQWSASSSNGSAITSYTLQYSLDPAFQSNVTSVSNNSINETLMDSQLIIPYADRKTSTGWYYFRVCAVNAIGSSPFTPIATIIPTIEPIQVQNLSASNLDQNGDHASGTVTLSFNYAINGSCPLLGYLISHIDPNLNLDTVFIQNTAPTITYTMTGLNDGQSYDMNVYAINSLGMGPGADITIIPSTIPNAPSSTITHADSSLTISWSAPNNNGNAITGYEIHKSLDGVGFTLLSSLNASTFMFTDTSLTNGTLYYYYVKAINANGASEYNIISGYPSKKPGLYASSVTLVNSNATNEGKQVTLNWTCDPSDLSINNGDVITSFVIRKQSAVAVPVLVGTVPAVLAQLQYSFVINGLTNGDSVTYTVKAVNRDGEGLSNISNTITVSGLPDAPSFSLSPSDQAISINITPGNNEGSAIVSYNIYKSTDNASFFLLTNTANTSYVDNGLTNASTYFYKVSELNSNGESILSSSQSSIPFTVPDAPSNLTAVHNNGYVSLSYTAPFDEGSAITTYKIYNSTDNVNFTHVISCNALSTVINGLFNGLTYYFKVSAVNIAGEGSLCSSISVTPSRSPSTVRTVTYDAYNQSLFIEWQAPLDEINNKPSGGLAYTYTVLINDGNAYINSNMTTTNLLIPNLTNGVTYNVQIYADNGVDTNYNIYYFNATPIDSPNAITNLSSYIASGQLVLFWSLNSTVTYFFIVLFDNNLQLLKMIPVKSTDSTLSKISSNYSYILNSVTSQLSSFNTTDKIYALVYSQNSTGFSPISNMLVIN